jgi:hypothetical protein
LLVRAEQGLGDAIQFARFLPELAASWGRVIFACDRRLIPLLHQLPVSLVDREAPLPPFDLWVDQMSLPRVLGTRPEAIPLAGGYLRAPPERAAAWKAKLPPGERVGIVWAGNPAHSNDFRRSMRAQLLAPLLAVPGAAFVSLQVGPASGDITQLYGLPDNSAALTDFAETAALVASLDLVIAADTSTAHLAGAMGVPVWIMLPRSPDWRWMTEREDTPWYASMRLFRQLRAGDWEAVIARVALALAARYEMGGDGS